MTVVIRTGKRKTCTKCGELKFLRDFYPVRNNPKSYPDGRDHYCKECRKIAYREKYARTRKKPDGVFSYNGRAMERKGSVLKIYWGEERTKDFKRMFPFHTNAELAIAFCCSERTIDRRAKEMGLEKDSVWLENMRKRNAQIMIRHNRAHPHYDREAFLAGGMPYRFVKGHANNHMTKEMRSEAAKKAWITKKRKARLERIKETYTDE